MLSSFYNIIISIKHCSFRLNPIVLFKLPLYNSVQFSSILQSCLTLCDPMYYSIADFPVHHQLLELLKLMSIKSVMPSNHLILCHPFSFCLQSFPASGSFPNELALSIKQPKYWHCVSSISPSIEYSGLISFRMDY